MVEGRDAISLYEEPGSKKQRKQGNGCTGAVGVREKEAGVGDQQVGKLPVSTTKKDRHRGEKSVY